MEYLYYPNSTVDQVASAGAGLIPEGLPLGGLYRDLDLEALGKDKDGNRRKSTSEKTANPYATLVWRPM
jgi:hypothetical protein